MAFIVTICTKTTLFIKQRHIPIVLARLVTNISTGLIVYFTASFFPAGNMEAVYVILVISISTLVDAVRKQTEWPSILKSTLAITGVVLITQLWNFSGKLQILLCEYWSGALMIKADHFSDVLTINSSTTSLPQQEFRNFILDFLILLIM